MKAFVDSREPSSLKEMCDFEQQELAQGDFYLPEHDVVVERKEASDFASSTTDGRLSEQADRMVAEHDHVFVIIENEPELHKLDAADSNHEIKSLYNLPYSNISSNSLTGMQTSLAVKRGVKIIYTESVEDTVYAVNRVFERFMDNEHLNDESGYVKTADTGEVDDVQVAMLMQVDGISEEKARDIVEKLGNIGAFMWAYNEGRNVKKDLQAIDGIGPKLAQRVIDAFQ